MKFACFGFEFFLPSSATLPLAVLFHCDIRVPVRYRVRSPIARSLLTIDFPWQPCSDEDHGSNSEPRSINKSSHLSEIFNTLAAVSRSW